MVATTRRTARPKATTVSPQALDSRSATRRRRARSARGMATPDRVAPSRSMPARSSSAGVANTATRSPTPTGWSRPGQDTIPVPSAGTTATGARWPNRLRNVRPAVSSSPTSTSATANRSPPSSIRWDGRRRQTCTNDGAARAAGSRMMPVPSTRSSARPTDGLARCTTRRTSGRASRTRMAISRVASSSDSTQMTAWARSRPASASPSPILALRRMRVTPQSSTIWARRGSGSSSTTTTRTRLWCSCSTVRSPTPWSPHTMTWPSFPQLPSGTVALRRATAPARPPHCF